MSTSLILSPVSHRWLHSMQGWRASVLRFLLVLCLLGPWNLAAAVDLNTADAQQLQQIKGIGPRTAELILEERQRGGPFDSLQDLADRVKGIGAKKIVTMEQSGLKVEPAKAASKAVSNTADADIRRKP
ncbi:ComEA family DNA-binding protein [Alcaligenes faecalis]|uniref:ComEA family DNA-binding protein n=1 Tax=Alcaligenes faecalis TaxID=511 RepID=UPI000690D610|nr:helix-hairpin-helix domain-containing protein [Alcaligenes faecalis]